MSEEKNVSPGAEEQTSVAVKEHSPENLLAAAIERELPVESIERLLAMRRELKQEAAREAFFDALSALQSNMPEIPKAKKVFDKHGKHRYSYASLDQIIKTVQPLLKAHGFSYTMVPAQDEGTQFTATIVTHHVEGHEETTSFTVPIDTESYMNAPQKVGSARTFAMRYAFCNAFGILTTDEDDDAGSVEIGAVLAAAEQIAALDTASDQPELLAIMKDIWGKIPENDERRPVLKRYYEERKEAMHAST